MARSPKGERGSPSLEDIAGARSGGGLSEIKSRIDEANRTGDDFIYFEPAHRRRLAEDARLAEISRRKANPPKRVPKPGFFDRNKGRFALAAVLSTGYAVAKWAEKPKPDYSMFKWKDDRDKSKAERRSSLPPGELRFPASFDHMLRHWDGKDEAEKKQNFARDEKLVTDYFESMGKPEWINRWLAMEYVESKGDPHSKGSDSSIHGKWQVQEHNGDGARLETDDHYCLERSVKEMLNYLNLEFAPGFPPKANPNPLFQKYIGDNFKVALFAYNAGPYFNKSKGETKPHVQRLAELFALKYNGKDVRKATTAELVALATEGVVDETGRFQNPWATRFDPKNPKKVVKGGTLDLYIQQIMAIEDLFAQNDDGQDGSNAKISASSSATRSAPLPRVKTNSPLPRPPAQSGKQASLPRRPGQRGS